MSPRVVSPAWYQILRWTSRLPIQARHLNAVSSLIVSVILNVTVVFGIACVFDVVRVRGNSQQMFRSTARIVAGAHGETQTTTTLIVGGVHGTRQCALESVWVWVLAVVVAVAYEVSETLSAIKEGFAYLVSCIGRPAVLSSPARSY